jgi:membrane-associated phospholipid phosphatase
MMRFLSNAVSWILHPLWMPFYLVLTLALHAPGFIGDNVPGITLSVIILVMTGILPAFNLILFRILGTIPDLRLAERKDRIMPFMFITMIYAGVTYLFYEQYPIPSAFKILLMTAVASLTAATLTLFLKVSIHALSISAVASILLIVEASPAGGQLFWPAALAIILGGLVMSARLYLNAHNLKEIVTGSLTGIICAITGGLLLF